MKDLENIHNIADTPVADTDATPAPVETPQIVPDTQSHDDIARLIAEAEQRGYLRGRNERIDDLLTDDFAGTADDDSCPTFLAHIRPGFWD